MINSLHPVFVVYDLISTFGEDYRFSFSKYFYRPQSPLDEREVFTVFGSEITDAWLEAQLSNLNEGWELALNSEVIDPRNRKFHVPMIDFVGLDIGNLFTPYFRSTLGPRIIDNVAIYDSGRSYHGYVSTLLSNKEWIAFMGSLLLLALPGGEQIIDIRWVGHRLIGGYSALRWSCNSDRYLKAPEHVPLSDLMKRLKEPKKPGLLG